MEDSNRQTDTHRHSDTHTHYVLSDIADVLSGYASRYDLTETPGSNQYIVQLAQLSALPYPHTLESIDWTLCKEITLEGKSPPILNVGDILLTARSRRFCAVLVHPDVVNKTIVPSHHFYIIRVKPTMRQLIEPAFLCHLLNHPCTTLQLPQHHQANGGFGHNRTVVKSLNLNFPTAQQQQDFSTLAGLIQSQNQAYYELIDVNSALLQSSLDKLLNE